MMILIRLHRIAKEAIGSRARDFSSANRTTCPNPVMHTLRSRSLGGLNPNLQRKMLRIEPNLTNPWRSLSRMTIFTSSTPEWHRPTFMDDASAETKEAWLESIDQTDSRVDSTAYLIVLQALGQSSHSGSPQRAEEWIRRLERKAATQPSWPHLQPTVACYNAVIDAWANSREDAHLSIRRAEHWLSKLKQKAKEQPALAPNTDSYNSFLNACSKGRGGRRDANVAREHAMMAQETLGEMIEQQELLGPESSVNPNTESFNYVIRAWTRCRDEPPVAYHVMDILKQMTAYQRQAPDTSLVLPNTQSFTMTMDAFVTAAWLKANNCQRKGSLADRQDPTKNGREEIEMVEDILQYMHKLYDAGLDYVIPNTVSYNTLITAWARLSGPLHPDAPLRAEKVLRKMIALKEGGHPEVAPDHLSFTKVILAWTNLGKDNAGKRAQWWLKKLNEHYEMEHDERLRLSVTACNAVIKALVKVGQVKEAEKVLVDMMHSENNEKIPFLKPNSESFAMVIHAWLKLDAKESEEFTPVDLCGRAVEWLDELVRREEAGTYGVTTSPELFDGVLKAASKFADVHPEILDLAIATLEKYRASRHRVDCMAYVWLLEAGIKAFGTPEFDKTRFDFIQLMRDCCHDGLLSNKFVQTLANGPVYYDGWTRGKSALITKELFPDWPLPPEWYRNLPHDYYIPTRKDFRRNNQNVNLRDQSMRSES